MRRTLPLIACALCALWLVACPETWRPTEKAPGSALWIGSNSEPLESSDLVRLSEAGIGEVYITYARLEPSEAGGPLIRVEAPDPPGSMPVTLAVSGRWSGGEDPESLAGKTADAVRDLRFEVESRGGVPAGVHFDLRAVESFESYAEFLGLLRAKLDRNVFLSTSLLRAWIDRPAIEKVAKAVDFVVPFLYGQRVDEAEDGKAWDYIELELQLRKSRDL